MPRVTPAALLRWEPIRIDLDLADVMVDLDPQWQDWTGPEAAQV